ncbi:hypothetical protein ZEAMMB73_Zm00001d007284 [Zea mays]|uniref:Uncharacterized protein n=1 Tax=Zea mays TaxID=4577 RepID=A0A1D6F567_MAIZE|nr:hypothetical protein ZEAMMB73_Zm00001d007284 [Zea mays]
MGLNAIQYNSMTIPPLTVLVAKKHLAGRIDRVDCSLDECQVITEATREEVTIIHGDLSAFQKEMETVHLVVRSLETKLGRLAYTQVDIYITDSFFSQRLNYISNLILKCLRIGQHEEYMICVNSLKDWIRARKLILVRQVTSSTSRPAIESSERIIRVVRSSTVMSASGLSLLAGTTIPPKRCAH